MGRLLLDRGDEAGLAHLERAMDVEPECVLSTCELALDFLLQRGREHEAERFRARSEQETLPVQFQLFVLEPRAGELEKRLRSYEDSLVYDREPA